ILIDMVYYILVGIFSSNLLYHKKDCFPTLLRVVAVFFYCAFFYSAFIFCMEMYERAEVENNKQGLP
ncbi:hypothetical protein, partial [Ruminococcus sp.]|uniref:hypothetical protein n=1 Tax=Ruminococcus sp. TaxID=41978 RepID=UPI002E786F9A